MRSALVLVALTGCAALNRADPADTSVLHRNRPPAAARDDGQILVVSYNVHMESAAGIARGLAGPWLRRADVVFLQEIESHAGEHQSRAGQVAERLGMSYAYAPGYGLGSGGSHGVAILSRWPLADLELIELPREGVVFNSARRVALGATVAYPGRPLRVYSVHLDNRINPSDRRRQLAPVLAAAAARRDAPVIIAGDMNTSPFCWLGHVVPLPCGRQGDRLEALVRERGFDAPATGSGPTSKWLGMRLDAVYARGIAARRVGVERRVQLSDHLPLWVVF
ncbi:MAG TPA: endonuclease/exonuclease/phosphatase family protein [Kofleriaceae bacterium]|jgi:endonuclease/exonuclease/phosphatase family metal-dependent hydrolase